MAKFELIISVLQQHCWQELPSYCITTEHVSEPVVHSPLSLDGKQLQELWNRNLLAVILLLCYVLLYSLFVRVAGMDIWSKNAKEIDRVYIIPKKQQAGEN